MPKVSDKNIPFAPCLSKCPQGTDIRTLLKILSQGEREGRPHEELFEEAWRLITDKNPLPAVCGRVCPHPCEGACNRKDKDCAVEINSIERFIGDWAITHSLQHEKLTKEKQPEKIAVIGSGPAGLSCAFHLARRGYLVTIFEATSKPGGMLRWGIPPFRLPRKVLDAEIEKILDLGIELHTNVIVGKDISLEQLQADFDSVFLGIGAQKSVQLRCPGEDSQGVYGGLEFLNQVNSGQKIEIGERTLVIGGGNTAVDAARVARRLGSKVTIVYRRTRAEMPAIEEEIAAAQEEGVEIQYLTAPIEIESENGHITSLICQKMELGEPDESGRRRPVPIPDDTVSIPSDSLIIAVSQQTDWSGLEIIEEEKLEAKLSELNEKFPFTRWGEVFAGGDVKEIGIVAEALNQGRCAAEALHAEFRELKPPTFAEERKDIIYSDRLHLSALPVSEKNQATYLPVAARMEKPWEEIKSTLPEAQIIAEARRCITCGESFIKHPKAHPIHLLRRASQIGIGTLLLNSYFSIFSTKVIYAGPLRNVCVPGLNCHSCPTAIMGCPIGMLQHFSATHRIPWFMIGFLGIIGILSGRFTCGWLCPWGLLQDILNWFKKLTIRIPKLLIYLKYAILPGLVFIIPYFTYEHWFSKLCPCGALIAGIPWVLWNPIDPALGIPYIGPDDVRTMFAIKMIILVTFLILFLFIKRPFCRTVCPLGAIYAFFNRISLVSLEVKASCVDCGQCRAVCPTDIDPQTEVNSEGCVKCLECTQCQHITYKWNWPWLKTDKLRRITATKVLPQPKPASAMSCVAQCHSPCGMSGDR